MTSCLSPVVRYSSLDAYTPHISATFRRGQENSKKHRIMIFQAAKRTKICHVENAHGIAANGNCWRAGGDYPAERTRSVP